MQAFIQYINNFIIDLYYTIASTLNNSEGYNNWLNKNIIDGTLIKIGMSWKELFLYASVWILSILFIVFFINIVFKVIGLICLR